MAPRPLLYLGESIMRTQKPPQNPVKLERRKVKIKQIDSDLEKGCTVHFLDPKRKPEQR